MNDRVQQMRTLRFEKGWTLEEIGKHFGGISRQRVHQLIGNTGDVTYEHRRQEKAKVRHERSEPSVV